MASGREEGAGFRSPDAETNRLAVASLVLGLSAVLLFLGPVSGIPAVCCGVAALRQAGRNPGAFTGRGMATAGIVLGVAASVLSAAAAVIWFWAGKKWGH